MRFRQISREWSSQCRERYCRRPDYRQPGSALTKLDGFPDVLAIASKIRVSNSNQSKMKSHQISRDRHIAHDLMTQYVYMRYQPSENHADITTSLVTSLLRKALANSFKLSTYNVTSWLFSRLPGAPTQDTRESLPRNSSASVSSSKILMSFT